MDHEFFSDYPMEDKVGWDWMSIQLDDGSDLMLFGLRDADGGHGPDTTGTLVDAGGGARRIGFGGVTLTPGRRWRSADTGAKYPVEWEVSVPAFGLRLDVRPRIDHQEVHTEAGLLPVYWEGAVVVSGERRDRRVAGVGYLEMTGYTERGRNGGNRGHPRGRGGKDLSLNGTGSKNIRRHVLPTAIPNGSPMDGEAVAVSINWLWSDENNYSVREMMGPQISAEAVDAGTVAVITAAADPLLPRRIYLGGVTSAKQILENPAGHDVHPIGTGPYVFEEWKQGQYWTATANPDWWGNTAEDTYGKIHFDRLRVVWRPEPIVRSAMVESGEAHIAMFLTKEECERFAATDGIKCIVKGSDTFLQFRLDYHGARPLLADVDFRKAIFTGIDWEGIRQNLMGLGEPLAGQMLPSVATGFDDTISQYPYDPVGAKAIIDEMKANGTEIPSIHISTRLGSTPRNGEMVEAMGAMLTFVGIPNTVAVEEPGIFNPRATTKPDPERAYAWLHVQANPMMDYVATFGAHYSCGGIVSVFCDLDFDARVA